MAKKPVTGVLANIPPDEFSRAANFMSVLRPIIENPSSKAVRDAAEALGCDRATVYRMIARYRESKDDSLRAILPKKRGRRAGGSKIDPRAEEITLQCIKDMYLQEEKVSVRRLTKFIEGMCRKAGIPPPARGTIRLRVRRLPKETVVRARKGAAAARQMFRPVPGSFDVVGALSVVQIDHALCDVQVVDRVHRIAIGRPWVTLALDVASRVVFGYHISLQSPSYLSTSLCLSYGINSKAIPLAKLGLYFEWPYSGIPDCIHTDNGADFKGLDLARALDAYQIRHDFRPPATPHFGGHIERLIGTAMQSAHLLPGTTFSNIKEKGDYDSEAKAVMTIDELEQWLCYRIHEYHHTVHSGIHMPPAAAWEREVKRRDRPIRVPRNERMLSLDFLPFQARTVTREGIRFRNIQYWHPGLAPLIRSENSRVAVHFDPRDLSTIYVRVSAEEFLEVRYADISRPAITYWEHEAAYRYLRQLYHGEIHEAQIFEAILQQREIVLSASAATQAVRKQALIKGERTARALEKSLDASWRVIEHAPVPALPKPEAKSPEPRPADMPKIYDVEDWS